MITAGSDGTAAQINSYLGIVKRKSVNETVNNSATLQDDNDLVWAVAASVVYRLNVYLAYNSNSTADLRVGWSVPSGTTMVWHAMGLDSALGFSASGNWNQGSVLGFGGDSTDRFVHLAGLVTTSTTTGNLVLRWAQLTANASNTNLLTGSYGVLTLT